MKPKHLFKIIDISGWVLFVIILLYLISGFAMTREFGLDHLISRKIAWEIHEHLIIPLVPAIICHVIPRLYLKYNHSKK